MSRVLVLIATIPARRQSCERLLAELARQSKQPDGLILVLDGYGEASAPKTALPVTASRRSAACSGAGQRWIFVESLLSGVGEEPPMLNLDDILVNLDDDMVLLEAHRMVEALAAAVESGGGASAAMGRGVDGKLASPGAYSRGNLIYAAGCSLAMRAKHLIGIQAFAAQVRASGGPDALGLLGDDDALVSAHLWKCGVPVLHAATGNIYAASGTMATSQTKARRDRRENLDAQRIAIGKITGWPWAVPAAGRKYG